MKIIFDIATIMGGIAALLFMWDRFMTFRLSKKPPDEQKNVRTIEPTPNRPAHATINRQTRKPVTELTPADEDLLVRQRILDSILYGEPDTHIESLWFIFAIPVYCCVGAVLVCFVTIYVSMFAGVLTSFISLGGALIGWKRQDDHGNKDDVAFLLLWGGYITFMASGAGFGTITDNKLDISDPGVRNVYLAAEAFGCTILGALAAIIRVIRRGRIK